MHNVVEAQFAHFLHHLLFAVEVEMNEMDTLVGQILSAARRAHSHPHVHAHVEGLVNDEATDKSCGSGNQNVISIIHVVIS